MRGLRDANLEVIRVQVVTKAVGMNEYLHRIAGEKDERA